MKGNRMGNQRGKGRLSKEGSHMGQSLGREPRGSGRERRGRGREQGQAGWAEELEELGPGVRGCRAGKV